MATLLTDIRDHWIAAGVVRDPDAAGALPPCWREPREGVPAPGETVPPARTAAQAGDPVIGLFLTGGIPSRPFESSLRESIVDVQIRGSRALAVMDLHRALRAVTIDRRQLQLGSQTVLDVEESRPLQRLGSDQQGFAYVWTLWVQTYAVSF